MAITGWPLRAGRTTYGDFNMRDERPVVNTEEEFNAEQANLTFWQMGAMGLIAPKATMMWFPPGDEPEKLQHGNFSWDQVIYEDVELASLPSYIASYVVNSTGNYTLTFNNSTLGRPNEDGDQETEVLAFQFAMGDANMFSTGFRVFLNVTLVDPQTFNIEITRNGSPANQPYVLMVF